MEVFALKKRFKILVSSIDYCITEDDLDFGADNISNEDKVDAIMNSLPQKMSFQIECDYETLYDDIIELISEKTGQLINSIEFTIIS